MEYCRFDRVYIFRYFFFLERNKIWLIKELLDNNCLPSRRLIIMKAFFILHKRMAFNDVNLIDRVQVVTCRFMIVNLLLRYNNTTLFSSLRCNVNSFVFCLRSWTEYLTDLHEYIPLLEFRKRIYKNLSKLSFKYLSNSFEKTKKINDLRD